MPVPCASSLAVDEVPAPPLGMSGPRPARSARLRWPIALVTSAAFIGCGLIGARLVDQPVARQVRAEAVPAVSADPAVPAGVTAGVTAAAGPAWRQVLVVWRAAPATAPLVRLVAGPVALATAAGQPAARTLGLLAITTATTVFVDATAYSGLAPAGQHVLLTHELTHLATGAASDQAVPSWLEEGFADYVGFRGSGIAPQVAGRAALDDFRAHGPRLAFPADAAFAAGANDQAVAYAGSFLLCRMLADKYGEAQLVTFYRQVAHGGTTVASALEQLTQASVAESVAAWNNKFRSLAR